MPSLFLKRPSPFHLSPFSSGLTIGFVPVHQGCDAESEGHHLEITLNSKCVPSNSLTAWPLLSSCLQVLTVSWGMVTVELIDRHFIISSWWLNSDLSFSGSLISFTEVQNVLSLSQVWQLSLLSNSFAYSVLPRESDMVKMRAKGYSTWEPVFSKLTHW